VEIMNIRRDKTILSKDQKADWEINILANDDEVSRLEKEQETIVNNWAEMLNSKNDAERAEAELTLRIAAASEGFSREEEIERARKEIELGNKVNEKLQNYKAGQSEEEFELEQEQWGNQYKRLVKEAKEEIGF
jgi:hypothetical protein